MKTILFAIIAILGTAAHAQSVTAPTSVAAGAVFQVTVEGGPGNLADWVGFYPVTVTPPGGHLDWQYLNGLQTPPAIPLTSATLTFTAPTVDGLYNLRWFRNNGYVGIASSGLIAVGGGSGGGLGPPYSRHLVVNGDSNVAAYAVSAAQAWPTLVADALNISHTNLAVGGKYAIGVLDEVPTMLGHDASVCMVQIGTNDMSAAVANGVPDDTAKAAYLQTMRQIVGQLKTGCGAVVLLSPAYSLVAKEASRFPGWVDGLRALAVEQGSIFIDIYGYMRALAARQSTAQFDAYYVIPSIDFYHLSAAGHALVANYVVQQAGWSQ